VATPGQPLRLAEATSGAHSFNGETAVLSEVEFQKINIEYYIEVWFEIK
jgi:hypothetical protein